jgi:hypothetical protein
MMLQFFKQMEVQPVTPTNGMNSGHHNQGILDLNVNSGTLVDKKECLKFFLSVPSQWL